MENKTIELLNYLIKGGSTSLTKSNTTEILHLFPKLKNLGVLTFSGKSSYHLNMNMENRGLLKKLIELNSYEKFLIWLDQKDESNQVNSKPSKLGNERKIFISHSSLDYEVVEQLIELLEGFGTPTDKIFCTSFEGYSIGLGQDFLETIKTELNNEVIVLFVLSSNFYKSPVSLCEMGATWVKTNEHIPILIPPFDFSDIKGVIPNTQGMRINDKTKLNSFKEKIETFLSLTPRNFSAWERKRDNVIDSLNIILDENKKKVGKIPHNALSNYKNVKSSSPEQDILIKQLSKQEWPNDFEMQVHYIKKQKLAIESLKNHNPQNISKEEFDIIRENAKNQWPQDFEMQLDYEQKQVANLRELDSL